MDPATQQMLENSNARKRALKERMDKLANCSARKRRSPLSERNATDKRDSFDDAKRQCENTIEDAECLRSYKPTNIAKNVVNEEKAVPTNNETGRRGKSRFAALAASINQWEDEENTCPSYKNNFEQPKEPIQKTSSHSEAQSPAKVESKPMAQPVEQSPVRHFKAVNNASQDQPKKVEETNVDVKKKICVWDKAVMATLEAQGFTKSPSASKISYNYNTPKKDVVKEVVASASKEKQVPKPPVQVSKSVSEAGQNCVDDQTKVKVSERVSMFSKPQKRKSDVDPALMSLSARVALFEKAMDKPVEQSARAKFNLSNKATQEMQVEVSPVKKDEVKVEAIMSPSKSSASNLTKNVHQHLIKQVSNNWQSNDISARIKAERQQELEKLRNRHENIQEHSYQSESDEDEDEPEQEEELLDRIEDVNESMEESVCEDYVGDVSDDVAEACGEIDKMLDEALEDDDVHPAEECDDEEDDGMDIATKPGQLYPSLDAMKAKMNSPSPPPKRDLSPQKRTPSPKKVVQHIEPEPMPLMHTISFYRKQNDARKTPVRKVVREQTVCSPESPSEQISKKQQLIHQQIKELQENVNAQQTIISQTSQALNLCRATAEFYGSSEQIEGERLLLIATQRRQASLNEMTRLKTEGAMIDANSVQSHCDSEGVLTLSHIRLPLKKAFVVATAEGKNENYVHNFLCLIRHGPQIIATEMISTQQGALSSGELTFSNMITIHNLESEFNVIFEVYGLQCPKEFMPHDKKYHIKKESSKLKLTPKKKQDMRLMTTPVIASPGGPLAVRTSSFAIIGHTKLCLNNLSRKVFALDKVPATSPLEGNVYMKVQCHADLRVDQRGFLTMFEDVSGFGAWHRRWCVLTGQHLAYWKYPDDEHKKDPIGFIDMRRCITGKVETAPRETCARLNTFLMVTMRPTTNQDKEDLITKMYDTVTTTKHLLSADSKQEKIWWCDKINQALSNIRKWDPNAMRPIQSTNS